MWRTKAGSLGGAGRALEMGIVFLFCVNRCDFFQSHELQYINVLILIINYLVFSQEFESLIDIYQDEVDDD